MTHRAQPHSATLAASPIPQLPPKTTATAFMLSSRTPEERHSDFPHHAGHGRYPSGTVLKLTAKPANHRATFVRWSGGGCSGSSPTCTITIGAATAVSATFA
jgi:hypothetical protein